ncbi:MAG: hypothetical protein LBL04_01655, partial [Bacteroidales bacterium]|nr:hypothetical protein [Bacteroidales bacterium]
SCLSGSGRETSPFRRSRPAVMKIRLFKPPKRNVYFLTVPNERKPSANERKPSANERKLSANEQKSSANELTI